MAVKRFDQGGLSEPVELPNGWLRVDAYLTRTGVFVYRNPDGTERREYRDPSEVFKADSLKSFDVVPLTNDHPPVGLLDATNTKDFQVGMVASPRADGDKMAAVITVTDVATIEAMRRGKRQLSNGYICELDETPGVSPDGERYDARQVNIRGNHVALVDHGRAGADVRVRMDAGDAVMLPSEADSNPNRTRSDSEVRTMKLRFDNAELEVTEDVAKAIEAERSAHAEALKASDTKAEQNAARADAAEAEVNKLREEVVFVFARVREEIKARFALETEAAKVLPSSKFDGLSDVEVKRQVAEKVLGVKLDGKSDVYVEASFDLALKQASTAPAAGLEQTAPLPRADSIDDARRKYIEALAKASA